MATYNDHPPDEYEHPDDYLNHLSIMQALKEASINLGYVYALQSARESQDLIDLWLDKTYDTLRARLSRQQMLNALLTAVAEEARVVAGQIRDGERVDDGELEAWTVRWTLQGYGSKPTVGKEGTS